MHKRGLNMEPPYLKGEARSEDALKLSCRFM